MKTRDSSSAAEPSPLLDGFQSWLDETGHGDDALTPLRQRAFEKLSASGMPTRKHEDWRFTELGPLALDLSARPRTEVGDADTAPATSIAGLESFDLHIRDGRLTDESRKALESVAGVEVHDLARGESSKLELSQRSFGRAAERDATALESLNAVWCDRGVVVDIAESTVLTQPLRLVFSGAGGAGFLQSRTVLRLARNAQATVIEDHVGSKVPTSTNFVVDVQLGDNAHLEHVKLVRSSCSDFQAASLRADIGRDARYRHWDFAVGGRWLRNDMRCVLSGENSEVALMGLVVAGDEQMIDHHTRIVHAASRARSLENYRHILDDRARAVFAGRVLVEKDVHASHAEQQNANLLLSDDARMNALPQLEIYNDDVTASHGATMGQLDEESLFYLRSRGIPEESARALMLWGFANTVVQDLGSEPLARLLRGEIHEHLSGLEFLEEAQ